MILRCKNCDKGNCNQCLRSVRAFIDPDGPSDYSCECFCNKRRLRLGIGQRKIDELCRAIKTEFGQEELEKMLAPYLVKSGL